MNNYSLPKQFVNKALKQADDELYEKHVKGEFNIGDPNNPIYNNGFNYTTGKYVNILGYSQDELIAKQYK